MGKKVMWSCDVCGGEFAVDATEERGVRDARPDGLHKIEVEVTGSLTIEGHPALADAPPDVLAALVSEDGEGVAPYENYPIDFILLACHDCAGSERLGLAIAERREHEVTQARNEVVRDRLADARRLLEREARGKARRPR